MNLCLDSLLVCLHLSKCHYIIFTCCNTKTTSFGAFQVIKFPSHYRTQLGSLLTTTNYLTCTRDSKLAYYIESKSHSIYCKVIMEFLSPFYITILRSNSTRCNKQLMKTSLLKYTTSDKL